MKDIRSQWLITALVAVVAVLATVLVMKTFQSVPYVYAQESAGGVSGVVSVLGPDHDRRTPLFLIDTRRTRLLIYEYDSRSRKLYLRAARSYKQDRELEDANFGSGSGPSVDDVKDIVRDNLKR